MFIVKVNGEIAGFVLVILDVPKQYMKLSSSEKTNVISDFFIMRKYRRRGVGKKVALSLFDQFRGMWEIRQTSANKDAYTFWKQVAGEFKESDSYQEEVMHSEKWNGPVLVFQS